VIVSVQAGVTKEHSRRRKDIQSIEIAGFGRSQRRRAAPSDRSLPASKVALQIHRTTMRPDHGFVHRQIDIQFC